MCIFCMFRDRHTICTMHPLASVCSYNPSIHTRTGTVFLIAKHEFETKRSSVEAQAEAKPLLNDIVDAGKAVRAYVYVYICSFSFHILYIFKRKRERDIVQE